MWQGSINVYCRAGHIELCVNSPILHPSSQNKELWLTPHDSDQIHHNSGLYQITLWASVCMCLQEVECVCVFDPLLHHAVMRAGGMACWGTWENVSLVGSLWGITEGRTWVNVYLCLASTGLCTYSHPQTTFSISLCCSSFPWRNDRVAWIHRAAPLGKTQREWEKGGEEKMERKTMVRLDRYRRNSEDRYSTLGRVHKFVRVRWENPYHFCTYMLNMMLKLAGD